MRSRRTTRRSPSSPDFAPAIEYRGEAYLALSQFKQVQDAYLALVRADQDQAAALMRAMEAWLNTHQENATADAKAFSDWVPERKAVAVEHAVAVDEQRTSLELICRTTLRPLVRSTGMGAARRLLVGCLGERRSRRVRMAVADRSAAAAGARRQSDERREGRARRTAVLRRAAFGDRHIQLRELPRAGARVHRRSADRDRRHRRTSHAQHADADQRRVRDDVRLGRPLIDVVGGSSTACRCSITRRSNSGSTRCCRSGSPELSADAALAPLHAGGVSRCRRSRSRWSRSFRRSRVTCAR